MARELPKLTTVASHDGSVELQRVEVRTPSGAQLVDPIDLRLEPGETLVITGSSGSGKTTLLRSLAQMWPYTSGTLRRPIDDHDTMFLSQMPYVPLGDLRTVVSYPANSGVIPDEQLQRALTQVALSHLTIRLNEVQDWAKVLSPGEQQRIAFARVLLTRPAVVFLDEATAAEHHSGQRQSPQHRRAASRPASGTAGRGRVATGPRGGKRARVGLT